MSSSSMPIHNFPGRDMFFTSILGAARSADDLGLLFLKEHCTQTDPAVQPLGTEHYLHVNCNIEWAELSTIDLGNRDGSHCFLHTVSRRKLFLCNEMRDWYCCCGLHVVARRHVIW